MGHPDGVEHSLTVNPLLDEVTVVTTLREHWGIEGMLRDLGSLQDQNVGVRTPDGTRFVLKIVGADGDEQHVRLQNAGMRHLADRQPGFAAPVAVPARGGADVVRVDGALCRLLTWVDGRPLADRPWLGSAELFALGAFNARVAAALDGFDHAALDRPVVWDARATVTVVDGIAARMPAGAAEAVGAALEPLRALGELDLPVAVIHADVTPANVQCGTLTGEDPQLSGLVDFGDLMRSWRIADVAAAVIGAAEHPSVDDVLAAARAVLAGYHSVSPVTPGEAAALWPLVLARAAVVAAISHVQDELTTDNWYVRDAVRDSLRSLDAVQAVPPALAAAAFGLDVGAGPANRPSRRPEPVPLVAGLASAAVLDLSVGSELMDDGAWQAPAALDRLVPTDGVALARWGEFRLLDGGEPAPAAPPTLHLGADVFAAAGTPVAAPVAGVVVELGADRLRLKVEADPPHLLLTGLTLGGLAVGEAVDAGRQLGVVAPGHPAHLHVQLTTDPSIETRRGTAAHADAWALVCPDPSWLLGRDVAAPAVPAPAAVRAQREGVVAPSQHLYYRSAPQMVRGWRHVLHDAHGRGYLDMINNIAAVGHSHPRVAAAAARQLRLLNTNNRFLYDALTRYCARIAALLPAGLDRVYLVNSGSEAADLALQLARTWTGRRDVMAIAGAYHGWTGAVLDISTSVNDRPQWRAELGPDVHVVEQPNPYRGAGLEACLTSVERAAGTGRIAAFVAEPLLGNQGAVEPHPGYLAGAFELVRRHGGLCIADEVQVGMARTGDFWAFEREAAVPDILYTAKATGNGHPLGVVVCSAEVAQVFDERSAFFASTGGGPVSCEIGLAVLDVIRDEGLQGNARTVGAHLRAGLTELAKRHELIGAVHGRGLYQGVELVADRDTKQPAPWAAAAISERLLDLGVVMQPTGDDLSVLKVKPPLTLDVAGADFFVAALDRALGELGAVR